MRVRRASIQEAHRAAERMIQAETERDTIRKEAATAREEGARLRGQVEVLQTSSRRPYACPGGASRRRGRG
ncbi:hypothetical protein [Nitrosospira sp. NRS527]|uniref:hypothetical protein n=1 Tax=Nitrosospira sp. NRS527 TaxID=155925 RepID=UPI001BCEFC66|nr:hypothetical protein [Nitrosospira sp. NRS527]